MSRTRPAVVATVFALFLLTTLPAAGWAQRDAERASAEVGAGAWGSRFVGSVLDWGQAAYSWFQAIIAEEHGQIAETPVAPPKP